MKKFKVNVPCDYIIGHLRYGHLEIIMEAEDLEELESQLKDDKVRNDIMNMGDIVIDDYEIDDTGDWDFDSVSIEEVFEKW